MTRTVHEELGTQPLHPAFLGGKVMPCWFTNFCHSSYYETQIGTWRERKRERKGNFGEGVPIHPSHTLTKLFSHTLGHSPSILFL